MKNRIKSMQLLINMQSAMKWLLKCIHKFLTILNCFSEMY